jgi:hypothetical protein
MHNLKELVKKILLETINKPDCGCGCKGTAKCFEAPILNENLKSRIVMTENMQYHIDAKKPLTENTFRYGSKSFLNLWAEARYLYSRGALNVEGIDKEIIIETNLGEYGLYENQKVPLDLPILEEGTMNEAEYQGKKVQIGKPKRGGSSGKKFYVYVMDKGKVKKVSFGDSGGLSTKINDPKARQAFAKRHNCDKKTDRTKAGYWSCRIGRYWKSLGGSKNFSGYW